MGGQGEMIKCLSEGKRFLDSALQYAELGWPVIPLHSIDHEGGCTCGKDDCSSPGKHPITRNGLKDATTDVEQIKAWWREDSDLPSNIGIVTGGESSLAIVDVDGDEGFEALGDKREDLDGESVPSVRTGRGFHFYFMSGLPIKTKPGFVRKVDIKADGGYVVAPPSKHISGVRYEWLTEIGGGLPDIPSWISNDHTSRKKPVVKTASNIIPEGQRNDTLFKLACSLRAKNVSYETALNTLEAENKRRCNPPLTAHEIQSLIESAYGYEAGTIRIEDFNCTDLGNAKRLVVRHGDKIRYCFAWKKWLIWDGKVWRSDESGEILRIAKDTVKQIYTEAAQIPDKSQREVVAKWAVSSESERRLSSMVSLAQSEDGIPISPSQLDADHYLLNCLSGTVDLKTGVLKPHDPKNFLTKIIPVEYKPKAGCPRWIEFLETIFSWNYDLIQYVQRAIGYSLTGDTSEQCLFILHGTGSNGKSTLLSCLSTLLGDYAQGADSQTFLTKKHEGVNNDIARMKGKRFVSAAESEDGKRLAESMVKQLTGGDTITARFLYGEYFDYRPTFKVWLAVNHKPNIKGNDHGIWRRIRLIPFTVTIAEDKKDLKLVDKLQKEMPGVLNWAVQGCLEWQRSGLQTPNEVRAATNEYHSEMDTIGAFISDCCVLIPDSKVQAGRLYEVYKKWCEENGEYCMTNRQFGKRLPERGLQSYQSSGNWWKGIGLKAS